MFLGLKTEKKFLCYSKLIRHVRKNGSSLVDLVVPVTTREIDRGRRISSGVRGGKGQRGKVESVSVYRGRTGGQVKDFYSGCDSSRLNPLPLS